jgi:hypothetical protein
MNERSNTSLSETARRIVDELRPHTPFAEAIVRRQAERAGLRIESLTDHDLSKLMPLIIAAASGFVDPSVLLRLKLIFLRPGS